MSLPVMGICFWQNCFNFEHTDHWKESDEEQEQGSEETEGSNERADIDPSWMEHSPCGWREIAGQRGGDDYEALEPHAHIRELNNNPDPDQVCSEVFEPEELWRNDVAEHHGPESPPVGTEGAIPESGALVRICAIPSDEELHEVGVTDDRTRKQDDFAHLVHMVHGHEIVEWFVDRASRNHDGEHHGESTENCTCHEVWREDRRMPTGNNRRRKVKRNDRVHGKHERR